MGDLTQLVIENRGQAIERIAADAQLLQHIGVARRRRHGPLVSERSATRECRSWRIFLVHLIGADSVVAAASNMTLCECRGNTAAGCRAFAGNVAWTSRARAVASRFPFQERSMKRHAFPLVASITFGVLACADSPASPRAEAAKPNATATLSAVKFWEGNAAANWTDEATSLAARRPVNVARLYTYLSLAQLRAAEDAEAIVPHPPTSSAIGGASAAILRVYFPADVAEIQAALDAQETTPGWPGDKHDDFAAGEALGRAAAARVIAYSASDLYGL